MKRSGAGGGLNGGRVGTGFEPELQELLSIVNDPPASGRPELAETQGGGGVLSTPQAWSVAVYGAGHTLRHADVRFAGWLADRSARTACLKLLDLARQGETRFGLIEMRRGGYRHLRGARHGGARLDAGPGCAAIPPRR